MMCCMEGSSSLKPSFLQGDFLQEIGHVLYGETGESPQFLSVGNETQHTTPFSLSHGGFWMCFSAFFWVEFMLAVFSCIFRVEFVLGVWKPGGSYRWKWQSLWVGQMATRGGWVQWVSDSLPLFSFSTFYFDQLIWFSKLEWCRASINLFRPSPLVLTTPEIMFCFIITLRLEPLL